MQALFIDPFFALKDNVIGYHSQLFLDTIKDDTHIPIVAGLEGVDNYTNPHTFLSVKLLPLRYIKAFINRTVPDLFLLPDEYCWAIKKSFIKTILKNVDFSKVDYIQSFSNPLASHIIACEIHKITGKPWIAQLYDPWTDSPYRNFNFSLFMKKDMKLESMVARNANAIIHTNHVINKKWADRYGEDVSGKSFVLPLVYSRERFQEGRDIPSVRKKDKVIISYIGKLFWDRNLRDVIKAISLIKKDNEELLKRLLIRVVGEATPQDVKMVHDNRCEEFFELIPFQDKNNIKNYYLESDAFLLIESQQNENVFFPSKLLDYFLYQRPIIGITPQVGETTNLLNESGNIAIPNGDVLELKNALLKLLGGELPNFDKNFYLRYSQESLRIQYNEVLKSVL